MTDGSPTALLNLEVGANPTDSPLAVSHSNDNEHELRAVTGTRPQFLPAL